MSRSILLALAWALTLVIVSAAEAQTTPSLQNRVDRLAEQIHLRYRHHEPSLEKRRAAVGAALREWNRVTALGDSPANRERMQAWLDAAMHAVMPGGSGVIPAVVDFVEPVPTVLAPIEDIDDPALTTEASVTTPPRTAAPSRPLEPTASASLPANRRVARAEVSKDGPRSQFAAPRAAQQRSAAKPVTRAVEPPAQPAPQRSKWSRNPSAAPLEWRDPFTDDPAASPNPLRSGVRRQTRRPVTPSTRTVKVDLRQLAADIRGYNTAIRDLQASVLQIQPSDLYGLVGAAEELSRLEERREFLDLYRSGLSVGQQAALPNSPSVELVRELVLRKATAMTQQAAPKQRAERRAWELLKERLARISGTEAEAF